jgi:hypothetical protein
MSTRNYNKIYVHTDREEGSEKLLLGYQNSTKEIILAKDQTTYFHVPFYTTPVKISESSLIKEGATAGSFPAASDRIFQNRKGYGNTTTNGNTSEITDGTWFCSWLSKDSLGNIQWMDRYYNPGGYITSAASGQMLDGVLYRKNNPVYRDVPSTLLLEPGVEYKYVHIGENIAKEIISTFAGISGERLRLNLTNWGTANIDTSIYSLPVNIQTNGDEYYLFTTTTETNRVSSSTIDFNNTYKIKAYVEYDSSYNFSNEFTWAFWAYSPSWSNGESTQLIGNYTNTGGTGIFIDTLSSYPFFVIPETGYGHMLYVNGSFNQFLDKSLHPAVSLTATPMFVAIDSEHNVIIGNADQSNKIRKVNHKGNVVAENVFPGKSTDLIEVICGQHDSVIVVTKTARYTYDNHLNFINTTIWQSLTSTVTTFAYNAELDTAELVAVDNVYDCKFIGLDKWFLPILPNKYELHVKFNNEDEPRVFATFGEKATNFAIDPYNRIWVIHGNNKISVYDTTKDPDKSFLFTKQLGLDFPYARKNISFSCIYDRSTNSKTWYCLLYYGDSIKQLENPQLFVIDLSGTLVKVVDLLSLFDLYTLRVLQQDQYSLEFYGRGDFTGYEYRRIFNNLSPFNNQKQLVLKTLLKNNTEKTYKSFRQYYSLKSWNEASWQHLILRLHNKTFRLYVNGAERITLSYPGNFELDYETRPSFYIGTPVGEQVGFNEEIVNTACIFNGKIKDIKVYDYALDPKNYEMFQRESLLAQNIYWSCPTPNTQYIETIERMFKNKMPGSKSTYFNITLGGTKITDSKTRSIIESEIRAIVEQIKPSYANFLKVVWID